MNRYLERKRQCSHNDYLGNTCPETRIIANGKCAHHFDSRLAEEEIEQDIIAAQFLYDQPSARPRSAPLD